MSGLVQPAGDASIDLGSDLTPRPPPSALLLGHPRPPPSSPPASSRSHPCLVPGGRRGRARKRERRESAGRQGVDGEVWWLGRHEEDREAARRRVEDLEVRFARAAPSATHVHSHLLHLRRPPPLTLDSGAQPLVLTLTRSRPENSQNGLTVATYRYSPLKIVEFP